ncbi:DMT family transporter [Serratia sp. root2]|uniref:DMT family transporter n=1 Tax=Serratia sp. root2 TaxID=3059676 RepID=UPI00288F548A|nr:DMT family transporter [Serratia sp. root2]MDT3249783.1 DMT family transporter [Serratia sp. root2]
MASQTAKNGVNVGVGHTGATRSAQGWINGFLGMLIFSGSLPATRVAVQEFDPVFLTAMRATIAALLALSALLLMRQRWPRRADIAPLIFVAVGVVIGFPLLTALALQHTTSAHSLVYIGLLPLATACFGVLRGGERPRAIFWVFSMTGALLVGAFALSQGAGGSWTGDALMVVAVLLCGLGYAEGAVLSRRLGGWQVISWALVIALPLAAAVAAWAAPTAWTGVSAGAWFSLGYISLFSMWIGFIFWYRGLAQGGIAAVGQLQLLQPFFGLALAGLVLHETVQPSMIAVMAGVVACVFGAKRFSR